MKTRDAFVRAVNDDGTIQIGTADPEKPYGEREVEITTITLATAYNLCGGLIHAIQQAHSKGGAL